MKQLFFFFICIVFVACRNNEPNQKTTEYATPSQGNINISADESFKPVIDEQVKIYTSSNPDAKINVHYKSQFECFKDLQTDSTDLIIVSRGLTDAEHAAYKNNFETTPQYANVAYDAVAAIVNINNQDSTFTIDEIKKCLSGEKDYQVILDGTSATSTVKFLQDSVLKGKAFGKNVVAVNGSDSVINAIKKTTKAIGFVGNSWVSNGYDKKQLDNLKQIKLALIECINLPEKGYFAKATQATLQYGQYPFARPLFYIHKENYLGLATGFANFLCSERGQLIFRRSCLVPSKINFNKRLTKI